MWRSSISKVTLSAGALEGHSMGAKTTIEQYAKESKELVPRRQRVRLTERQRSSRNINWAQGETTITWHFIYLNCHDRQEDRSERKRVEIGCNIRETLSKWMEKERRLLPCVSEMLSLNNGPESTKYPETRILAPKFLADTRRRNRFSCALIL